MAKPADTPQKRIELLWEIEADAELKRLAIVISRADFVWWVDHFVWTYDPKRLDLTTRPFVLFPKQRELAAWMQGLVDHREEGLLEKSRDVGASWIMAMFALHKWLFMPGFRTTFGSFKQEKVDQIGNSDSIFEKFRLAIEMLPKWIMPDGWRATDHDNYMRLLNPENGNQIIGEVGMQMGRSGRSSLFCIDEAAFLEHFKAVARAVSSNSDARIWTSTANGMANGFYVKREATRQRNPALVFRIHWRDDPRKTEEWAAAERSRMEPDDWASEHEIDYGASVERQLIKAEWVEACVELGRRRAGEVSGLIRSGLDVGAGKAESVLATVRGGAVVFDLSAWRDPDAVDTASIGLDRARVLGSTIVQYDATGVGFAQGAIMARMGSGLKIVGVNVGEPVPDSIRIPEGNQMIPASERFANLKAYGWWLVRERAKASWEVLNEVATHPLGDCLLIAVDDPTLSAQLSQPTWSKNLRGKRQIDKAPDGARSPDRADAVVLAIVDGSKSLGPVVW